MGSGKSDFKQKFNSTAFAGSPFCSMSMALAFNKKFFIWHTFKSCAITLLTSRYDVFVNIIKAVAVNMIGYDSAFSRAINSCVPINFFVTPMTVMGTGADSIIKHLTGQRYATRYAGDRMPISDSNAAIFQNQFFASFHIRSIPLIKEVVKWQPIKC